MAAPVANLAIQRGDTTGLTLTVLWPLGAPDVDLHDYSVTFTAKNSPLDPDSLAVIHLTRSSGITVNSGTVADIQVPAAATLALPCLPPTFTSLLYYDVQIIGPDAKPHTVVIGTLTVNGDITQATS